MEDRIGKLRRVSALGGLVALLWVLPAEDSALAQIPPGQIPGQPGETEAPTVQKFKDWEVQCRAPAGNLSPTCFMVQDVTAVEGEPRIIQVVVGQFGPKKILGLLVFVPLEVRLPPGIRLRVDRTKAVQYPLERCTANACRAEIVLDKKTLARLKRGNIARISFLDGLGRPVKVDVSLAGFTAAFRNLN